MPNYWVEESIATARWRSPSSWAVGFRDIANATVLRTLIAAAIPMCGSGNKFPLIISQSRWAPLLPSVLASFVVDYSARQKVGGTTLNFFLVRQFPVISPAELEAPCPWDRDSSGAEWLTDRALELTYTSWDIRAYGRDLGCDSPPFRWNDARRALLRAEVDSCFFLLYGVERDDVDYIMETFPIVRRRDEAAFGEFRTKRLILEVYDAMAEAIASGKPYQTILDPPPADPSLCHPESTRPDWAKS